MDDPNNTFFPAKLWRLVNSPEIGAIRWDSDGDLIVIDQQLCQIQLLSPGTKPINGFKTNNFSSLVRQLNLYGFKKAQPPLNNQGTEDARPYHYYYNPNFKRNHPELVANLQRLTVVNKAKMEAGVDIKCMSQHQLSDSGQNTSLKRKSPLLQPTWLQSPPQPYHPNQSRSPKPHSRTPVPPRYLVRGLRGVPVFAPGQHLPVSLRQRYSGVASNIIQVQQGLLNLANPGNPPFTRLNPQSAKYQPPYYPSVCQSCYSGLVQSNISSLQTELSSSHRLYQGTENQEGKTSDINLDTVFQIADEMMQTSSSAQIVIVETPKNPVSVLKSSPGSCKAMPRDNSASSSSSSRSNVTSGVVAVSSIPAYKYESVTSVPEQIPEEAVFEASSDQEKDAEVIVVEISDQVEAVSQRRTSRSESDV